MQNKNELFLEMIADISPEKQCALISVFVKLCQRANLRDYIFIFSDTTSNLSAQLGLSSELIDELLEILESRGFIKKVVENNDGDKAFQIDEHFKIAIENDDEFIQKVEELEANLKNRLQDRQPSRVSFAPEGMLA